MGAYSEDLRDCKPYAREFLQYIGGFGAIIPLGMAGLMGWTPDVLGLHQIRAVSMAMAVMGVVAGVTALKARDHKPLVVTFIALTLAFAAGRLLGLIFDGVGPVQTYIEIGFELIWAGLGYLAYNKVTQIQSGAV